MQTENRKSTWTRLRTFMQSSTFLGNVTGKRSFEYDAAGSGRRSEGWGVSTAGPNTSLVSNIDVLRRRSRHEARTNAWAASISETVVTNVIGAGIKPMTKFPDLQDLWNMFSDIEHERSATSQMTTWGRRRSGYARP